jgi:hypothetical protein
MEKPMRKLLVTISAVAMLAGVPAIANADPADAAAGAAVGAGVGFAVGGPVGAAVGAGVGGTVGAGTPRERYRDEVVIERREPRVEVRERNCYRDSLGNRVCEEYRR